MRIAIVGAGIAGLSCALRLQDAEHDVTLFDKGRGAGGRMSTRRVETSAGNAALDHGAQYLTARDPAFVAAIDAWAAAGVVARWPAAGDDAWIGTPGMNAIVKHLVDQTQVHWQHQVTALRRSDAGWHVELLAPTPSRPPRRSTRHSTPWSSPFPPNRPRRSWPIMIRPWRPKPRPAGPRQAGPRC
ncbi:FAD-dependent oxidoreductase [Sphingomonas aurantiaca]|uniref:FAD-dependent oxidoreductase n=1 Tax=Sphingomonas aurantiaca TaxID=185949 RepID=UPI002FE00B9A